MKKIMFVLLLTGCATASRMNDVSLGMTKQEVLRIMGNPTSTSAQQNIEVMNYSLREKTGWENLEMPYTVILANGRVASYGKRGDFGNTQQTKQVVEVINR